MADAQGGREFVDRDEGRIAPAAFEACDVELTEAGAFCELLLGEPGPVSVPPQIVRDEGAHIHARQSAEYQLYFLTTIVVMAL